MQTTSPTFSQGLKGNKKPALGGADDGVCFWINQSLVPLHSLMAWNADGYRVKAQEFAATHHR